MHYKDHKRPTRSNNSVLPCYFKRPHEVNGQSPPSPPRRRILVRETSVPEKENQCSMNTRINEGECSNKRTESVDARTVELEEEVCSLKQELSGLRSQAALTTSRTLQLQTQVRYLQTTLQRLDPTLLSDSQLHM